MKRANRPPAYELTNRPWIAMRPEAGSDAVRAIRRLLARRWASLPTSNRQRCPRHQTRSFELWGIERGTPRSLA